MSFGPDYSEPQPDSDDQVERRGLRAAGQLVARTVLTRGITLLGTVALARMLTPADFGVFAVITLIVTIITVVGDLGIGAGLVQQREEPSPADLETVLAVQLALFGGLGLAAAVAGPALAIALDLGSGSSELALLLALTILMAPLRGIPIAMLSRSLRFGPLAASEVVQQVAFFGVAVGSAAMGAGVVSFGLAGLAQGVVATVIAWAAWGRRSPRPRLNRAIAARLWRFGIRMQGVHIAAWAKDAVVPVFGGLAGGVSAVGYLQFAWRNGQLITAVDDIVTRVGFPALSRLQHDPPRLTRASGIAMEAAVLVAVGIQAWLIASAPVLVPVVFSAQWEPSVDAFRLVSGGAIAGTLTAVIRTSLNAAGQSGTALRAGLVSLAVLLIIFPAGILLDGVTGGGIAFLVGSLVALAVHAWTARARVAISWVGILRVGVMGAAAAVVGAEIVAWRPDVVGLVVSGLVYVTLFGALAFLLERPLLRMLWAGLRPRRRAVADGS
jgi:O-antigen/teichoic acid export membrane protein